MGIARKLLLGVCVLMAFTGVASAKGRYDLRGTWNVSGTGGAVSGQIKITSMNRSTGTFSGTSFSGRFVVKGTETGNQIKFTQSGGGYVATDLATVSGGGNHMAGTWTDSNGASGNWTGHKVTHKHKHKQKHKHKHHQHHKHHKKHKKHS